VRICDECDPGQSGRDLRELRVQRRLLLTAKSTAKRRSKPDFGIDNDGLFSLSWTVSALNTTLRCDLGAFDAHFWS
jgi:hypothetical protein